jgi:gamma-glutamyltranspeptidase/glutathione hydrolase
LAHALRLLAASGPETFYKGEIAAAIVKTSEGLGGTMTAQDLASYSSEWVAPISIDYRGWRVYELPPNTQGMAALEMLNIMSLRPVSPEGPSSAAEIHQRIEAMKLAYSDLRRYDADPRSVDVPVAALLSRGYARQRAALIDPQKANCKVAAGQPVEGDTISGSCRPRRQYCQLDSEYGGSIRLGCHGGRDGIPIA